MDKFKGTKFLRLPQKPRVRKLVSIIPVQAEALLVKDGKRLFSLKGRIVQLLHCVLNLLDGHRNIDEIVQALPAHREENILKTLEILSDKGLLEDAAEEPPSPLVPEEIGRYEAHMAFFSQFAEDRFATQLALKRAKVTLLGLGEIGARVLSSLVLFGVGEIRGADWEKVKDADVSSAVLYRPEDLHQGRAFAAQKRAAELNPYVTYAGIETAIRGIEDLYDLIRGQDLAILCLDGPSPRLLNLLNEACLAEGVPWTSGCLEDDEGTVGPSVIPQVTPCYKCYELRLKANLKHYHEYLAYEQYLVAKGVPDPSVPTLHPFSAILAGYLALEAIKLLTNFMEPMTLGHVYVLNLLNFEATLHEILKLPRCPACSPARFTPAQRAWEV